MGERGVSTNAFDLNSFAWHKRNNLSQVCESELQYEKGVQIASQSADVGVFASFAQIQDTNSVKDKIFIIFNIH